jgi:hypothetical protein
VISVLLLLAGARWLLPDPIEGPVAESGWTRRSRAAFVPGGFHPPELDAATGHSFSWTNQRATLEFPGLRRSRAHRVTLAVRGIRPPDQAPAALQVLVDGQLTWSRAVPGDVSEVTFEIPRRPDGGAVVSLEVATPFVPGGADKRALGVIVDRVGISPVNGAFVPRGHAIGMLALSVFLAVLALRLCGLRGTLGAVAGAGVAVGFAWLLLQDAAFLGGYADRLARIGAGACAAGALVYVLRTRWPAIGGVPEWGIAAGLVLAASAIKLGVFWHPLAIVGDGIFQVHRAQVVHGGQYIFTSITPKPFFEFPYPVALYVFALPFWNWFPTELDLLRLLRAVTVVADALAGVALYGAVRRQWGSRVMALSCAVLWPLATAPLQALSNANLTNLFGQSMFGAALAGIAWMAAASSMSLGATAAVLAFLVIAFLSHFGTVTVGLATMGMVGLVLVVMGRGQSRRLGFGVFGMMLAAVAVAWVLYYSDSTFTDVYRRSWAAVAARESDDSSKIVAAPAVKLERWWSGTGDDYGRPGVAVILAAALGVFFVGRQGLLKKARSDAGSAGLVFVAWLFAWLALTALGALTPLTLRANLAVAPALIALAAIAIGTIASYSRAAAIGATILGVLVAWDGFRILNACIQLTTGN